MSDATPGGGGARIIDRGYRSYDGPRHGVDGAVRSTALHSFQRALGLRRAPWYKVIPLGTVFISYFPAIALVGIVALFPDTRNPSDTVLPTYGDYYTFIIAAIMLFVSVVGPEVLCTDRRSGMLGIYLASPLDRDTYLLGKAAAIASAVSLVCLGPPLLLLVANILQSHGPSGVGETLLTLARVLAAGVALTLLFTSITMGISSFTDRRFVGMAGIILVFLVTIAVAGTLAGAGLSDGWSAVAPTFVGVDLASRIHGERGEIMPNLGTIWLWLAWAAWTVGGFAIARYRLHQLQVTR